MNQLPFGTCSFKVTSRRSLWPVNAMVDLLVSMIILISILFIITIAFLIYISGAFLTPEVSISSDIPYLKNGAFFYYKANKGSYDSLGNLYTEVYCLAPGIMQCAIHFDDPQKVSAADCRSAVGAIFSEVSEEKATNLEMNGFKRFILPPIYEAVYMTFPHVSLLSVFIGMSKAIPILRTKLKELECSEFTFLTMYDDEKIHYIGLLKDNDDFLVEEFTSVDDEFVQISAAEVKEALNAKEKIE